MKYWISNTSQPESLFNQEPVREESFSEFDHFPEKEPVDLNLEPDNQEKVMDDEEFEGFIPPPKTASENSGESASKKPLLKIADVPPTFRSLEHYILEMIFLALIVLYLVNYIHGRSTNSHIAAAWLAAHEDLFLANFSLIGDDPSVPLANDDNDNDADNGQDRENEERARKSPSSSRLRRESDNLYTLWCSGRVACIGMLVELRLLRRHNLPSLLLYWLHRPASTGVATAIASDDRVAVKVMLDDGEMDAWVMAIGVKKSITTLAKEHFDLATYPADRRGQRVGGLPEGMIVLSEVPEATASILNPTVRKIINDHQNAIEYIYISDQYSGPKASMEDLKPPKPEETQKVLIFSFILDGNDVEGMKPLFNFVFYLIEKTRKLRLGKEAKAKSDRARAKISESLLKSVQVARQEAAQNRRDEQRRAMKERIMTEEDPEKARRLEEKEQKRESKKRQQRIKMVKMKGM